MPSSAITTALLQYLSIVSLVGVTALAFVLATIWLLRLRTFVYAAAFSQYLRRQRSDHYASLGMRPRRGRLKDQISEEAQEILADGKPNVLTRNSEIMADTLGAQRIEVDQRLNGIWPRAQQRFRNWVLAVSLIWSAAIWWAMTAGRLWDDLAIFADPAFAIFSSGVQGVVSIVLAAIAATTAVLALHARGGLAERGDSRISPPPEEPPPPEVGVEPENHVVEADSLGGDGQVVRALHLSAGGFDTVMHLGAAHALWTIQGRAPDVIVGISAGAIQAAAIAEILQASEKFEREYLRSKGAASWTDLKNAEDLAELQRRCLLTRAFRLRQFIEAEQRAPERLLDALMPDLYQIDTSAPVFPLQQPGFAREERRLRLAELTTQNGLTRLYNDVLNVPLSIGTITRIVRRILGLIASCDIPQFSVRWLVRLVDAVQLVLLLGTRLPQVAALVPIVLGAYRRPKRVFPVTAGMVLLRTMWVRRGLRASKYVLGFVGLLLVWCFVGLLGLLTFALTIPGLVVAWLKAPDNRIIMATMLDALRGFFPFVLVLILWSVVAVALVYALGMMWSGTLSEALGIAALLAGIAGFVTVWLIYRAYSNPSRFINRLLGAYNLADSILTEHGLRTLLVDMFDRSYYDAPSMDEVVDAGLRREYQAPDQPGRPDKPVKTVGAYSAPARLNRIHLGLAVADTATGRLEVVPPSTRLIDGLLAAVAKVPLFPAKELASHTDPSDPVQKWRRSLYIDAANVSNEPIRALLRILQTRLHHGSKAVHVYSMTPFPISKQALGGPPGKLWLDLVENVWRALRLKRYRDATLERRLTEVLSEMLPETAHAVAPVPGKAGVDGQQRRSFLFRIWMAPVELESDIDMTRRLVGTNKDTRRELVYQTIADGCRASLQVMLARTISESGRTITIGSENSAVRVMRCADAVRVHREESTIPRALVGVTAPGCDPVVGPGLSEVCRRCALWRDDPARRLAQTLQLGAWDEMGPTWPHERAQDPDSDVTPHDRFIAHRHRPDSKDRVLAAMARARSGGKLEWPIDRVGEIRNGKPQLGKDCVNRDRPTVSLLFSGGVFRGVYQMGVLNALNELGIRPDLIAGASVGSITAAMVADAFGQRHLLDKQARIARLASIYLTIDRLVLTDRFADFVRNLTLRAADARFSIRQADRVFRKYDASGLRVFDRNLRRVVAGLERLFYLSPYELNHIVRALRARKLDSVAKDLINIVQRYLDRMQIGEQALGAEPLDRLISEYVTKGRPTEHPAGLTIDELRDQTGIQLLATTTDLSGGTLQVCGERPEVDTRASGVLREVLLASSAFPGVFRPRFSWEAWPGQQNPVQFIDGGVMDNLPLDAVMQFLTRAAEPYDMRGNTVSIITAKPAQPHLIIAASLEVSTPQYMLAYTRRQLKQSWLSLRTRAKQLGYNRKLETYQLAQERMARVAALPFTKRYRPMRFRPIDATVIAIKPEWLCSTFAFHPMLRFKRSQQARSIAHGCASTLLTFAREDQPQHFGAWGVSGELPSVQNWQQAFQALERAPQKTESGCCWLRPQKLCPFSIKALNDLNTALQARPSIGGLRPASELLSDDKLKELSQIHRLCSERETHLREI